MSRNNCQRPSIPLDSKEDVREYLIVHRILSKETARSPKKMNIALVEECYAYLQDVSGTGPVLDAAALDAKYLEIVKALPKDKLHLNRKLPPFCAEGGDGRYAGS